MKSIEQERREAEQMIWHGMDLAREKCELCNQEQIKIKHAELPGIIIRGTNYGKKVTLIEDKKILRKKQQEDFHCEKCGSKIFDYKPHCVYCDTQKRRW